MIIYLNRNDEPTIFETKELERNQRLLEFNHIILVANSFSRAKSMLTRFPDNLVFKIKISQANNLVNTSYLQKAY